MNEQRRNQLELLAARIDDIVAELDLVLGVEPNDDAVSFIEAAVTSLDEAGSALRTAASY